jgi:hypothetical protein
MNSDRGLYGQTDTNVLYALICANNGKLAYKNTYK